MKLRVLAWVVALTASLVGAAWAIWASDSRAIERSEIASVEMTGDSSMSASPGTPPDAVRSRQVLGVWLLAVTGTAIGLRAHKSRTI